MKKSIGAALIGLPLAACQSTQGPEATPADLQPIVAPRTLTKTLIQSPDPTKWTVQGLGNDRFNFTCRYLACPAPSRVRVIRSAAPTRSVDEAALKEFARTTVAADVKASDIRMGAASASYEYLSLKSSTTTKMRGFPVVLAEVIKTGSGQPQHGVRAYLFAGNSLIDTFSISTSREVALANLHAFINAYGIEDGPTN